jgi:hypothetical protein
MKSMGIFWLFAEGLIMVYVRKGLLFLERGDLRQRRFLIICMTIFAILTLMIFGQDIILNRLFNIQNRSIKYYYYSYLWNFLCTLWVIIEGVIAIYVFRFFNLLRTPFEPKKQTSKKRFPYGIVILLLSFFLLYAAYHTPLGSLINRTGLTHIEIQNIFRFYIKICGLFWILIEWMVGLTGLRLYFLLKRKVS